MEQEEEERNWSELNVDILMLIFQMVGIMDVLKSTGSVCRAWRKLAIDEPELWRRIDITHHENEHDALELTDLASMAIDRSGDRLEEFWIKDFGNDHLLRHLSDRTSVLKSLRLISCYDITYDVVINAVKKQPLLEDLQIQIGYWGAELPELVGKEVPNLKHFKLNIDIEEEDEDEEIDDKEAFGIAKTMHQLHSLQLIGNKLSNEGLKAILEGCPHLESLDIRRCYNVDMDSDMVSCCARLTTLKLPYDDLDDDFLRGSDFLWSMVDSTDDEEEDYDDFMRGYIIGALALE